MKKRILLSFIGLVVFSCLFAQTSKSPFSQYGYKKQVMYTSSKGEFEEFHGNENIVEIGSVYFNTSTKAVVGYVNEEDIAEVAYATSAMSVDPLCEKYYWISPYAYCLNNPIMNRDPDGRWVESVWDAANVVLGAKSFVSNVKEGNIGGSIVDGIGVAIDVAAVLIPVVPGGVGSAIKAARAADDASDALKTAKNLNTEGRAGKTIVKENGVTIKSYGTNDVHKPAHAHVKGGGPEVRVGANGKPLKGQPELSDKQRKVIDNNRKDVRKEVNAVGKANKKLEE
jgi:hypothetical protein